MKSKATGIQYNNSSDGLVYDLKIDVKKDGSGKIISGLVIGTTLEQNMASIMIARQGDLKRNLDIGVDFRSALLDADLLEYRHQIKEQFAKDGLNVKHLDLYNIEKFSIDAGYE